jgi:uncharacterized protein YsxB (DUF464 family)
MIRAEFFGGTSPKGFRISGHSGSAPAGEDLVCAAVTSAVRLTEAHVNDVLSSGAAVSVEPVPAAISLTLPERAPEGAFQALEALRLYLRELSRENPKYLTLREHD